MLHTLRFSLQNAFYFIMLTFLVSVLVTFDIQSVLKFNLLETKAYSVLYKESVRTAL
jgi:hypothetical protein